MINLEGARTILSYSDWANERLHRSAATLSDDKLDQPFDMGVGSLRKTLIHIHAGESVWLQRWQNKVEVPWPNEEEKLSVATIAERSKATNRQREEFIKTIVGDAQLSKQVSYRDSKGSLFTATLADMMLQMCMHSHYHRAQAVNMLRRLGAKPPELDYMMSVRKPVA